MRIMEWPDSLPIDLDYCRTLRGEEQIIASLLDHSDEHLIRFFEVVATNETWTAQHQPIVKGLLEWLTNEFSGKRLKVDFGKRAVAAIQPHIAILQSLLPQDLSIRIGKNTFKGNSLMWGAQSVYFQDIIERKYEPRKILNLAFPEVLPEIFKIVDEYITTGTVEYIWRRPLDQLMAILVQAGQWRLKGLIEICADVVRRYVNRDTATSILNTAQAYVLTALKDVCCEVLNHMSLGVIFEPGGEADLVVKIEELRELTLPMLIQVAPSITHLVLKEHVAEAFKIKDFLPKCVRIASFSMSGSKGFDPAILPLLPHLRELVLSNCSWLTNDLVKLFLTRLYGLKVIDLSENAHIGYLAFKTVSEQTSLETFICVYCAAFEDDFLESVARGCSMLTELRMAWCPKISDAGLRQLGILRPGLRVVDVSNCTKISDAGIHDLVRPCLQLRSLSMQYLPLVSEDGILKIPALCPTLKYLDIRLCNITDAGIARLCERFPYLELL